MALSIEIVWEKPFELGPKAKLDKALLELLDDLPEGPGIYVFARTHGSTVVPMYIGKALRGIRQRIKEQANNHKLMEALKNAENGGRVLLVATVKPKRGQQLKKVLEIAERAHIEHALTQGQALINIQGTKTKRHEVNILGRKSQTHPFPKTMFLDVKKPAST